MNKPDFERMCKDSKYPIELDLVPETHLCEVVIQYKQRIADQFGVDIEDYISDVFIAPKTMEDTHKIRMARCVLANMVANYSENLVKQIIHDNFSN